MSENNDDNVSSYAEKIKALSEHLEKGDTEAADTLLDEITRKRENSLFQELGKLTREFHEALQVFRMDTRLSSFADGDFSDARDRLKYVISMTDQAADRSLTAAENSIPLCQDLRHRGSELQQAWERFNRREMEADEFRSLSKEISEYFVAVEENTPAIEANLTEVIMAQDFQDLTGQIITKVITLVDEVEQSLVELVRISGKRMLEKGSAPMSEAEAHRHAVEAQGPIVPGVDDVEVEVVSGQDEVDDLLSSLGF